jgi:arylsulfatase A-like enzyme
LNIFAKCLVRALVRPWSYAAFAALAAGGAFGGTAAFAAAAKPVHNVILFVPDGLRAGIVNADTAPTMNRLREHGVHFANTHALFPTFTTANASAFATGHYLGDTGDFANTIASGYPVQSAGGSTTPFLENDTVLGDIDAHFAGNYLNEESLLAAARARGFATAAIGKLGPVSIQDLTGRSGANTVVIDDWTGQEHGLPLGTEIAAALERAGLPLQTPPRGDNGRSGDATTAGTTSANQAQQAYFVDVVTKVLLPRFRQAGKPFVLVFWSRDPDGSQHNEGDSLGRLVPGINGPTSMAGIKNADDNLAAILRALADLGLERTTDVFVSADHGFSTISKQSKMSEAAHRSYADVPAGLLPPGFLAIDLAIALGLPLADPDAKLASVDFNGGHHSIFGNGAIGKDASAPDVLVASNGGSDLLYLPQANAKELAPAVVQALLAQDYVSGLFVDDSLGRIPGTLPLSTINLEGRALTPHPSIVVNFRSFDTGCGTPTVCSAEVADTTLQQGQGMHGSFGRGDTANFMAAIGPDFRAGFVDHAPSSNADVAVTLARILKLHIAAKGTLVGRPLTEALTHGKPVPYRAATVVSAAADNGLMTYLRQQFVGNTAYFDVGGFPGRTVGLE